jgi:hypothetical protein
VGNKKLEVTNDLGFSYVRSEKWVSGKIKGLQADVKNFFTGW